MTISLLVVEPDQSVRDQLRFHLHKNQIALSVLYSAAQLVSRVELECPSAILLRAESPMIEAREALRQLRLAGYDMPILVLSTSGEIVDKIVAFELGADDYIVDPVDPHELTARIKRAVQRCNRSLCDAPEIREKVSFGSYQKPDANPDALDGQQPARKGGEPKSQSGCCGLALTQRDRGRSVRP
jgi:two-component system phosphate regulon response regulator OmpR